MPYIKHDLRDVIDDLAKTLIEEIKTTKFTSGELNYILTSILLATAPKNYGDYNNLVGVLECCKLEMYRRKVALYEEAKIKENGDL